MKALGKDRCGSFLSALQTSPWTRPIINTSRRRGREGLHQMEVSAAGLRDSRYTSGYKAGITFSPMWSTFNRLWAQDWRSETLERLVLSKKCGLRGILHTRTSQGINTSRFAGFAQNSHSSWQTRFLIILSGTKAQLRNGTEPQT